MEEIDPEYLLWAGVVGHEREGLHAVIMAHVPDRNGLLAYQVLCGVAGKFLIKPWDGELKCEVCERERGKLNIVAQK
jgi:hypothetical protein